MYSHGKSLIGRFLPGRNPNMHANVDFSPGEIHTFHANVDFSPGEINLFPWEAPFGRYMDFSSGEIHVFPWEVPHWSISPREKSKHACKCGFLPGRNPHIPCKCRFLPRRNPLIPMGSPPLVDMWVSPQEKSIYSHGESPIGRFLPGRNPNMQANVDFFPGEIHTFHAHVDFSPGEIHLFPWEAPHW